jgi:4-hydroxythreonine-4-phosphate dehydrogenase
MGDPAGVGPEVLLKAVRELSPAVKAGKMDLIAVGARSCLEQAAQTCKLEVVIGPADGPGGWPVLPFDEAAEAEQELAIGAVSAEAGRLAYKAIERAVALTLEGSVDAIVTAPINKEALNAAGYSYAGHTELLAELTDSRDSCMMLAHERLRVTHVSTHTPLSRVPSQVTPERVTRVIELTIEALHDLGIADPCIGVCGLNPHAGEGGMFGDEEGTVLGPVIEDFRQRGQRIDGPVPGDTIFVKAVAGDFDAVVAMFHDQGHIPVKLLGFSVDPETGRWTGLSGVNVTLGLPIIRTSVDHGTAFDIAGRGEANAQSMVEAIEFAAAMAVRRVAGRAAAGGK